MIAGVLLGLAAALLFAAGILTGARLAGWWLHDRRHR